MVLVPENIHVSQSTQLEQLALRTFLILGLFCIFFCPRVSQLSPPDGNLIRFYLCSLFWLIYPSRITGAGLHRLHRDRFLHKRKICRFFRSNTIWAKGFLVPENNHGKFSGTSDCSPLYNPSSRGSGKKYWALFKPIQMVFPMENKQGVAFTAPVLLTYPPRYLRFGFFCRRFPLFFVGSLLRVYYITIYHVSTYHKPHISHHIPTTDSSADTTFWWSTHGGSNIRTVRRIPRRAISCTCSPLCHHLDGRVQLTNLIDRQLWDPGFPPYDMCFICKNVIIFKCTSYLKNPYNIPFHSF